MKLIKIKIKNFRLLQDVSVDINEDLSLIIGKNNSGKTSFLTILEKFLSGESSKNKFSFYDFSSELRCKLQNLIKADSAPKENEFPLSVSMKLFIEYSDDDDLSRISKLMQSLAPDNNIIVLAFEYILAKPDLDRLKVDFAAYAKESKDSKENSVEGFLLKRHKSYFKLIVKSLFYDMNKEEENDKNFTNLTAENIFLKDIINFKAIRANRDVSNTDSDKNLSTYAAEFYNRVAKTGQPTVEIEEFERQLAEFDSKLNENYKEIFSEIIGDIKKFGGMQAGDSRIAFRSALEGGTILKDNTKLTYETGEGGFLPESYNGLGYMNLISIIFQVKLLIESFKKETVGSADINLLFIEEPEAHTHPQMQAIFMKNIRGFLKQGFSSNQERHNLFQTILTTHSSHIVAESDFEDIRYFKRHGDRTESVNLNSLRSEYGGDELFYKFLKQYLTLQRADLFFAEKAIFIEGDTERILLPAMMKKIDIEEESDEKDTLPLMSQNISIVEVGAYAHKFTKFINFIGTKTLIITDLDSVGEDEKACEVNVGKQTSNNTIKYFYGDDFFQLKNLKSEAKIFCREAGKWVADKNKGTLFCAYQTEESNYHARSFEDAFLNVNRDFIEAKEESFPSLQKKRLEKFCAREINAYEMARDGIYGKPSFAMDILLNSDESYRNWNIPAYIKEGVQWLKKV